MAKSKNAEALRAKSTELRIVDCGKTSKMIKIGERKYNRAIAMPRQEKTEWTTGLDCLRWYVKTFGNSRVPLDYMTKDGFKLGDWVSYLRTAYNAGELSGKAVRAIERIPEWVWSLWDITSEKKWSDAFYRLNLYVKENGTSNVPVGYVDHEGFCLGVWAKKQKILRREGSLSKKHKRYLNELLGWTWAAYKKNIQRNWYRTFRKLRAYVRQKGYYSPSVNYVTKDGFHLGAWTSGQRHLFKKGLLAPERQKLLESIPGWQWKLKSLPVKKRWLVKLSRLKTYVRRRGKLPEKRVVINGFKLGSWLTTQRYLFNCGRLNEWKHKLLEQIPGWKWPAKRNWSSRLEKNKKRSSQKQLYNM